jgi:hypothetical protein
MNKTYFYLTGICPVYGTPSILTLDHESLHTDWFLVRVVGNYGKFSEDELMILGNKIDKKQKEDKLVELQKELT